MDTHIDPYGGQQDVRCLQFLPYIGAGGMYNAINFIWNPQANNWGGYAVNGTVTSAKINGPFCLSDASLA